MTSTEVQPMYRDRDNMADEVITKDYWTIILMGTQGHTPTNIDSKKKESGSVEMLYTFSGTDACELYNDYISGKDIKVSFHDVERTAGLFKKNLQRN